MSGRPLSIRHRPQVERRFCQVLGTSSRASMLLHRCVSRRLCFASRCSYSSLLANILGKIVEDIYAVRPQTNGHAVLPTLEGLLDRWYLELPEHLCFAPSAARQKVVPPYVLTLHMQYWCAVLLLHRAL